MIKKTSGITPVGTPETPVNPSSDTLLADPMDSGEGPLSFNENLTLIGRESLALVGCGNLALDGHKSLASAGCENPALVGHDEKDIKYTMMIKKTHGIITPGGAWESPVNPPSEMLADPTDSGEGHLSYDENLAMVGCESIEHIDTCSEDHERRTGVDVGKGVDNTMMIKKTHGVITPGGTRETPVNPPSEMLADPADSGEGRLSFKVPANLGGGESAERIDTWSECDERRPDVDDGVIVIDSDSSAGELRSYAVAQIHREDSGVDSGPPALGQRLPGEDVSANVISDGYMRVETDIPSKCSSDVNLAAGRVINESEGVVLLSLNRSIELPDLGVRCTPLICGSIDGSSMVAPVRDHDEMDTGNENTMRSASNKRRRVIARRLSSSEDEDRRPPPAKKRVNERRNNELSIKDKMLKRLLDLDMWRKKCTTQRIQGGISGKMKNLIINLLEDLQDLDMAESDERRRCGPSLPDPLNDERSPLSGTGDLREAARSDCKCADQEALVARLSKENLALKKELENIKMKRDGDALRIAQLAKDQMFLKNEIMLRDTRDRMKPKGQAVPTRVRDQGIVSADEVERIVGRVLEEMGIGIPHEVKGDVESVRPEEKRTPHPLTNKGGVHQTGERTTDAIHPSLEKGNHPNGKRRKRKKKRKKSMAAAEAEKRASAGHSGQPDAEVVEEVSHRDWRPPGVSWQRKAGKRKQANDSAVITIKCREATDNEERTATYKEALVSMRGAANLTELGITSTSVRRGRDGGLVIELPNEPEARSKARALVEKVQGSLPVGVRVACPQRMGEIIVVGLDPSVTAEEVLIEVANIGGCHMDEMSHSGIKDPGESMGRVWIKCPLSAAMRASQVGVIRVGWSSAKIALAKSRPVQCHRCHAFGHMKNECTSPIDRSRECYRCGCTEHKIADCPSAVPVCSFCPAGKNAHKMGTVGCIALKNANKAQRTHGGPNKGTLTHGVFANNGRMELGRLNRPDGPRPYLERKTLVGQRRGRVNSNSNKK